MNMLGTVEAEMTDGTLLGLKPASHGDSEKQIDTSATNPIEAAVPELYESPGETSLHGTNTICETHLL